MRFLLAFLLAPLLLAPVRLKDSTPAFFTPPAQGPAPESYSLPAAAPLITPTVIPVSPTVLLEVSPTATVTPSLNLPSPPSVTPQPRPRPQPVPVGNLMSPRAAAICVKALTLVQDVAMLSYRQKNSSSVMALALSAATPMAEAAQRQWPDLTTFNRAVSNLPWFQPQKSELRDAVTMARTYCGNPLAAPVKIEVPRPD